jgi:hypothetical protein
MPTRPYPRDPSAADRSGRVLSCLPSSLTRMCSSRPSTRADTIAFVTPWACLPTLVSDSCTSRSAERATSCGSPLGSSSSTSVATPWLAASTSLRRSAPRSVVACSLNSVEPTGASPRMLRTNLRMAVSASMPAVSIRSIASTAIFGSRSASILATCAIQEGAPVLTP